LDIPNTLLYTTISNQQAGPPATTTSTGVTSTTTTNFKPKKQSSLDGGFYTPISNVMTIVLGSVNLNDALSDFNFKYVFPTMGVVLTNLSSLPGTASEQANRIAMISGNTFGVDNNNIVNFPSTVRHLYMYTNIESLNINIL
jgi:hypothetical protein